MLKNKTKWIEAPAFYAYVTYLVTGMRDHLLIYRSKNCCGKAFCCWGGCFLLDCISAPIEWDELTRSLLCKQIWNISIHLLEKGTHLQQCSKNERVSSIAYVKFDRFMTACWNSNWTICHFVFNHIKHLNCQSISLLASKFFCFLIPISALYDTRIRTNKRVFWALSNVWKPKTKISSIRVLFRYNRGRPTASFPVPNVSCIN